MNSRYSTPEVSLPEEPRLVQFTFVESDRPLLLSLSSLLYDIELAHDLSVLLTYPEYGERALAAPFFFYRDGRPLLPAHRARTSLVSKQSPLFLEIVVGASAALWTLLQIIDKVSNWNLNREKLRLEIQKLQRENSIKRPELDEEYEERLQRRGAKQIEQRLIKRLDASEFKLVGITVQESGRSGDPESQGRQ